jgi:gliding motility-associated-like protein
MGAAGQYSVTATVNGCTGPAGTVLITVNAIPSSPAASSNSPLCAGNNISLIASNISGASYSWGGPNGFSSSLQNPIIVNAGTNNSGIYSVTATVNGCTSSASSITVIVNPIPSAPSLSNNSPVCTGNTILLNASTIAGAIYNWTGPNGFTSSLQNPSISNATILNAGTYNASVTVNGCLSSNASTIVNINQTPAAPTATNNGALCEGSNLNLSASVIAGASYNWTGPNGFTSSTQNCSISNVTIVNVGQYLVRATVNGCTSVAGTTTVMVDRPSVSNAGINRTVCVSSSVVQMNGTVSGGSGTGIWSTSGTGNFSPSNTNLNASYNLSGADKTTGVVSLTLTSTNNGACPLSASSINITLAPLPVVNAGNDISVCADANVFLNGSVINASGGTWSSSGSGSFTPSNTNLNAIYNLGSLDKSRSNVTLTLTTTGNGSCAAVSGSILVSINPLPIVNIGGDKYVIEKNSIVLSPQVNESGLKYKWSPASYLTNDTILNPVCQPPTDITYTLTVKDNKGCSSTDNVTINVLKIPVVPNVFTPNGDGINDTWQIKYLATYPGCTVQIYTRYGQLIFQSTGYSKPWDGTVNGKSLPAATYYYIIDPKNGLKPMSGFVDIVR